MMKRDHTKLIAHDELKRLVDYDAETGVFSWRVRRSNRITKLEVGCTKRCGSATRGENNMNSDTWGGSRNKTGKRGVARQVKSGRYMARLSHTYLGTYDTPEDAHDAYSAAAKAKYGDFVKAL